MRTMASDIGGTCPGCGNRFAFLPYHLPHCQGGTISERAKLPAGLQAIADNLAGHAVALGIATPALARMAAEATVRKSNLADLVNAGPVRDQHTSKRKTAKSKSKRSTNHRD